MRHYETHRWIDFDRGLVGEPERAAMEAHLLSGCVECRRKAEVLGKLVAIAESESRYEPPANVRQRALAIFSRTRPERTQDRTPIPARLVYDSMRDPLPVGMRTGDRPSQALFEAENYSLDLHLKRERVSREHGAPRMVLVGQIADREEPGKRMSDIPVALVSGSDITAHSVSNQLGEFHLEYVPQGGLQLQIPVDGGRRIDVPLPHAS